SLDTFTCTNCKRKSEVTRKQASEIRSAKSKGALGLLMDCSKCGLSFYMDFEPAPKAKKEQIYHCPISGCTGYAVHVENSALYAPGPFWGCGECGSVWREKDELFDSIDEIVKRFSWRKPVYVRGETERWVP